MQSKSWSEPRSSEARNSSESGDAVWRWEGAMVGWMGMAKSAESTQITSVIEGRATGQSPLNNGPLLSSHSSLPTTVYRRCVKVIDPSTRLDSSKVYGVPILLNCQAEMLSNRREKFSNQPLIMDPLVSIHPNPKFAPRRGAIGVTARVVRGP